MTREMIIFSMDYIVENFLTSKVASYVSVEGKIYGYIPAVLLQGAI